MKIIIFDCIHHLKKYVVLYTHAYIVIYSKKMAEMYNNLKKFPIHLLAVIQKVCHALYKCIYGKERKTLELNLNLTSIMT